MPVDHRISVTFDGTDWTLTDSAGDQANIKRVRRADTIAWELTGVGSMAGRIRDLEIRFNKTGSDQPFGQVITANAGAFTAPVHLHNRVRTEYPYSVAAVMTDGSQVELDPQIVFED